jgi:hypothetical protein
MTVEQIKVGWLRCYIETLRSVSESYVHTKNKSEIESYGVLVIILNTNESREVTTRPHLTRRCIGRAKEGICISFLISCPSIHQHPQSSFSILFSFNFGFVDRLSKYST